MSSFFRGSIISLAALSQNRWTDVPASSVMTKNCFIDSNDTGLSSDIPTLFGRDHLHEGAPWIKEGDLEDLLTGQQLHGGAFAVRPTPSSEESYHCVEQHDGGPKMKCLVYIVPVLYVLRIFDGTSAARARHRVPDGPYRCIERRHGGPRLSQL
ncbi:hypothetical protein FB451DRAFT_1163778 [Mycena latifolia]|nr:hypothetical protein FB451DRAFT_1163778 [Mycena latifolia]